MKFGYCDYFVHVQYNLSQLEIYLISVKLLQPHTQMMDKRYKLLCSNGYNEHANPTPSCILA